MTPSSAKAKGRAWQQEICTEILAQFPCLEKDDVRSTSMGCGGEDILFSPLARKVLRKTSWECKNKASQTLYNICAQAQYNSNNNSPIVALRLAPKSRKMLTGTKKPPIKKLIICDLEFFLTIMKAAHDNS